MPDRDAERVLIVDDQRDDTELATQALLDISPSWEIEVVRSAEEGLSKAGQATWTLILLDHKLPRKGGLEILPALRQQAPDAGIIMLTGHGDERVAVQAMRAGADYYLPKSSGFLVELPLVVREVLEKRHLRLTLARSEDRYRRLLENIADIVYELDEEGRFRYISSAVMDVLGYSPEEVVGSHYARFLHPDDLPTCGRQFHERRTGNRATRQLAMRLIAKSGAVKDFEVSAAGVYDSHRRFQATAGLAREVTARKRTEDALRMKTEQVQVISQTMLTFLHDGDWQAASTHLLRCALAQSASEYGFIGVMTEGPTLRILVHEGVNWDAAVNRAFYEQAVQTYREQGYLEFTNFENLFGHVITSRQAVVSNDPSHDPRAGGLPPGHPPLRCFLGVPILHGSEVVGMIGVANRPAGYTETEQSAIEILMRAAGILYDSYRRRQRELALETQLRQAQKMEAVGRLAGGIAHDFNNLLTPILGYAKRLARRLPEDTEDAKEANLIVRSAARAAELTGQLLVFSRQQISSPKVLDLNHHLRSMEGLLRWTIGDRITLEVMPGPDLKRVVVDPIQIEQLILNLVVNARDAMPQRGVLRVSTDNATEDMTSHPSFKREGYVRLTVSDTGVGMSKEVQMRIFEPFYTTKEMGKGTGLGLAIVDGIVKQAGGFIEVHSAVNQGTAFQVFLPATDEAVSKEDPEAGSQAESHRGTETVLLAEDNEAVRSFAAQTLRSLGYTVLEAANGEEAVRLEARHKGPLHLLVSDIVMPKMNGWELARTLKRRRVDLPVLLMSGYPSVMEDGQISGGDDAELLQKPFTGEELAKRVRATLNRRKHGNPPDDR